VKHWSKQYSQLKQEVLSDCHNENVERALSRKLYRTNIIGTVMPGFPL
jgi:predicted Fe-S protein YdhL (DUF1289 family)